MQKDKASFDRNRRSRQRRGIHPFQCVLCVVVAAVLLMSVAVLVLGIVRAVQYADDDDDRVPYHHSHDDDDNYVHHQKVHHSKLARAANTHAELHTLQQLQKNVDEKTLLQTGWLPAQQEHSFGKRDAEQLYNKQRQLRSMPSPHVLDLREHKARISDDTFYLGSHPHPHEPGVELHTYAFVHYARNEQHTRNDALLNGVERSEKYKHFNRSDADVLKHHKHKRQVIECGAPIAIGARWKQSKGYVVYPQNAGGFEHTQVVDAIENAADTWRCVFREIHQEPLGPLLGVEEESKNYVDFRKPSGVNRVAFAKLYLPDGGEDSTLAVSITHGVYSGPVEQRFIGEFSTVFNDQYVFGDCSDTARLDCREHGVIDLQSIATHEMGHDHVSPFLKFRRLYSPVKM